MRISLHGHSASHRHEKLKSWTHIATHFGAQFQKGLGDTQPSVLLPEGSAQRQSQYAQYTHIRSGGLGSTPKSRRHRQCRFRTSTSTLAQRGVVGSTSVSPSWRHCPHCDRCDLYLALTVAFWHFIWVAFQSRSSHSNLHLDNGECATRVEIADAMLNRR